MRRHNTGVEVIRSAVLVLALGFTWSSFASAEEPASSPAPSSTVQEENATPAESGEVQERAVLPLPIPQREPPPPPNPRFQVVLGGSGVLDKETLLVWQRQVTATLHTFYDKDIYCGDTGNRRDWRIPTGTELGSLLDPTTSNPALPIGHPFYVPNSDVRVWIADQHKVVGSDTNGWSERTHAFVVSLQGGRKGPIVLETRVTKYDWTPHMKVTVHNLGERLGAIWCVRGPILGTLQ